MKNIKIFVLWSIIVMENIVTNYSVSTEGIVKSRITGKILNGLFASLNIKDIATDVMRIIDKIEKIGEVAVKSEMKEIGNGKMFIFIVWLLKHLFLTQRINHK